MALTPMMIQYFEVKETCKDCILFFRLGDFYEMFFDDAQLVAKELELVLTGRDCGLEKRAPMCGIPHHAANIYVGRLIAKGYKVAICEQVEDPALAKGIVKREVIKIITPGTYTDSGFLEETKNNYIMSIYINKETNFCGLCFCDVSTGEFTCTETKLNIVTILDEISKFTPKEIIVSEDIADEILKVIKERFNVSYSAYPNDFFIMKNDNIIKNQFHNYSEKTFSQTLLSSILGLLSYIMDTQKKSLSHIDTIEYYDILDYVSLDANSRRNLELTETLRDKTKKGSLLWVLDRTNTAMGARRLRKWLDQPLINKKLIDERLEAVEEIKNNTTTHEDLKDVLVDIYDIERLVGKISSKNVNAKELISLKNSIEKIPKVKSIISILNSKLMNKISLELDDLQDIHNILEKSIINSPAISIKEGNIIKEGFNSEIDELRRAKAHGKEWIATLESDEKRITGIKSLKVGYNRVFGYYIEVTKLNIPSIPEGRYIRKQTLSNAERYITPELKEMEDKILGAQDKLVNIEYEIFTGIREEIEKHIERMKNTAKLISEIDCLSSLATIALENNYTRPKINKKGILNIIGGRHPVVEKMMPTNTFIENDTYMDEKDNQLLLITGPNMAGKSTYMRQVALITIMAQMGSFVPCASADISICDKIFTRIGASDDLAAGKSTFMVEMWEVSNILKNATNKSLVLLDEVGRGTSTYDGLSIAWSVIEYICKNTNLRSKTLFATHYHELTKLEGIIKGVKNYSVAVKKIENEIVFLRKIVPGGADESYGIEVAKLAGLPKDVINRANEILISLEKNNTSTEINFINKKTEKMDKSIKSSGKVNEENIVQKESAVTYEADIVQDEVTQISFTDIEKDNILKEIKNINILSLTPMDGFNKLYELVNRAKLLS
ncbi:DNA mismatch repair protein MutS [Clostridium estertheticum]|uniref:DNA mismatch repair protein MutS n=1 Tax=Clostridium estertheticum TaxID=238834 RepID=A0AA47ELA1_9CLOT|nr:DNA mismatch repair protein MutS [Clostridium estertheticum]MBU3153754.1 DNA mismatch repair protein MutS [Clostridium estertheticum]MBU3200236.1 DNA mismatch repair protein MutS [Clostridium estertheticum]WAG61459.1 DNA mismatch repair protein MutS [Clostridium estertheticum]WAG64411.1 DNA mismatch repair protein MutS [Clostridium estertheticum]